MLNIIEPTLYNFAGHGYSYVSQVAKAASEMGHTTHVWLDNRGKDILRDIKVSTHPWFYRKLRQVQKIALYYRLIRKKQCIYVCTSELWDIKILSSISKLIDPNSNIICHFHQFKQKKKKIIALKSIAKNSPNICIFTPTTRLSSIFEKAGFTKVKTVPCPSYPPLEQSKLSSSNNDPVAIFAGAARDDKGFSKIVNAISLSQQQLKNDIKFKIQASKPNSNRYDEKTQTALEKLWSLPKSTKIKIVSETLNQREYQDFFKGSIALLLYDQSSYSNKFSGVMLDAVYANCPVITTKNTWMADVTEKYNIGITLEDHSPESIISAIQKIKSNYNFYIEKTEAAKESLQADHDPRNTIRSINEIYS